MDNSGRLTTVEKPKNIMISEKPADSLELAMHTLNKNITRPNSRGNKIKVDNSEDIKHKGCCGSTSTPKQRVDLEQKKKSGCNIF
jgi:hypothetical protein